MLNVCVLLSPAVEMSRCLSPAVEMCYMLNVCVYPLSQPSRDHMLNVCVYPLSQPSSRDIYVKCLCVPVVSAQQ